MLWGTQIIKTEISNLKSLYVVSLRVLTVLPLALLTGHENITPDIHLVQNPVLVLAKYQARDEHLQ